MSYNPLAFGLMMVALGSFSFAAFLYEHYNKTIKGKEKGFGSIFLLFGIIGLIFGFIMYITEPIPGHYIEVYGVGYFIFSMLMLLAGTFILKGWDLRPASYLAAASGLVLLNSAYTVLKFEMSRTPLATTAMFALAGLGGIGSLGLTHMKIVSKKVDSKYFVLGMIAVFGLLALLMLYSGLNAQLGHVESALAG